MILAERDHVMKQKQSNWIVWA